MIGNTTLHGLLTQKKYVPTVLGYGYLYNGYAVLESNFAPTDWKVPEYNDLVTLYTELGGQGVAGGHLKKDGDEYWNTGNMADNSSGFTAIGVGIRGSSGGFANNKIMNYIWTKTTVSSSLYYGFLIFANTVFDIPSASINTGCTVRLLYTGAGSPSSLTDYDGNEYDVIQIGDQYWIQQNWKCTHLNDGTLISTVTNATTWAGLTTPGLCAYDNDESNV
jgi:uncharacterized protein (TIGR02145 family)